MKSLFPNLISMSISGLVFMSISFKLNWNQRMWTTLNKKINHYLNGFLWISTVVVIQLIVRLLCDIIGTSYITSEVVTGFTMGFCMAFMPIKFS